MTAIDQARIEAVARAICGRHCDMSKCSCQPRSSARACREMSIQQARAAIAADPAIAEMRKALMGVTSILVAVKFTAGLRGNQIDRLEKAQALLAKYGG